MTGSPKRRACSNARRRSAPSASHLPSSETATAPAICISPNSASSPPACPRVTAPIGYSRGPAAPRAFDTRYSEIARLSLTGSGVGHRAHGREPARRRRFQARRDRLRLLASRLAQVRVEVDEARENEEPRRVEDLRAVGGEMRSDFDDHAVPEEEIEGSVPAGGGIHEPPARHEQRPAHAVSPSQVWPVRRRYSTAIRTATPLETCSRMSERGGVGHVGRDLDPAVHRSGVHDDGLRACARASRAAVRP